MSPRSARHGTAGRVSLAWGSGAGGHAVYCNRELGIVLAVQGRRSGANLPELVEAGVRGPNPLVR
jgi:hypothetical protein